MAAGPAADATGQNEPGRLLYVRAARAALLAFLACTARLYGLPPSGVSPHASVSARLDHIAYQASSRWDALEHAAALRWDDTRSNAAGPGHSLAAALHAWALYDELRPRLADTADTYEDAPRYAPVLALDGAARLVYDRAYALYWQRDYARAERLFRLLLAPGNTNGFTIGNSHFWLGYLLDAHQGKPAAALPHYLVVHTYPACLVFTACAYHYAARIYHRAGLRDVALALYATQVPSIDYWRNEHANARAALAVSFEQACPTNVLLQALRIQRAADAQGLDDTTAVMAARRRLSRVMPLAHIGALAAELAHGYSPIQHETECIQRALTGPDAATNDPALVDMLLHAWPTLDTVADLHPEILTNRPASNNIFPHIRRAMP